MNKNTILTIYIATMLLLIGSWVYIQTQTTVTTTCYEYGHQIPCDIARQKQAGFLPSAPQNYTFNLNIT